MGGLSMAPWLASLLPAAVPSLIQGIGGFLGLKSQQKAYDKMQEYNAPKAQMTRLQEAGLSPWLMYSQGNVGNMSTPRPAGDPGISSAAAGGLDRYMAVENFKQTMRERVQDYHIRMTEGYNLARAKAIGAELKNQKELAEFLADFPDLEESFDRSPTLTPKAVRNSFRRKMNELKMSLGLETLERLRQTVKGMSSDNVVRAVKAKYAKDYGMVGGDWTQGLGLVKSLGSLGRSAFSKAGKRPVDLEEDQLIKQFRKIKTDDAKRKANRFIFENKYNR